MLTAQTLPPVLGQNLLLIIDNVIKMLSIQKETEIKSLRKAGRKEIKAEDDDDEEEEGSSDEEEEDEGENGSDMEEDEEAKGDHTEEGEEHKGDKAKTDTQESDGEDDDE